MEKKGWRAVIYDAPWASFKKGQPGVIISNDGKTCETTESDITNIVIEAEENELFTIGRSGHVLFKQNGSDLFDIACIEQVFDGTYEISAQTFVVNDCITYDDFIKNLVIVENLNGVVTQITDVKEKKKVLVKPTKKEIIDILKSEGGGEKYEMVVTKGGAFNEPNSSWIVVLSTGDEEEVYKDTVFYNLDTIKLVKTSSESYSCSISLENGSDAMDCEGGTAEFVVNHTTTSTPIYQINIGEVYAERNYDIVKCENIVNTSSKKTSITYSLEPGTGAEITNQDSSNLTLSIPEGVSSITLILKTSYPEVIEKITLSIPS